METILKIQEYFANNSDQYVVCLFEHIKISLLAFVIATVFGVVCGYLCFKYIFLDKYLKSIFNILRIIPSLAILILLIPIMGVGVAPSLTALVLLAIPPVLINTTAGFQNVSGIMIETANGLGMTKKDLFWKVLVPQAMPSIFTGMKTALVEIIASATLASKIGAGGLGGIIFTGLSLFRTDLLIVGGASVALLAVLSGVLFNIIERLVMKYRFL